MLIEIKTLIRVILIIFSIFNKKIIVISKFKLKRERNKEGEFHQL